MTEPPHACEQMSQALNDATSPINYSRKYRRYGVEYATHGSSQHIEYCPFCGARLPDSLRDQWFERLEADGIDPWDNTDLIPDPMQSDQWWRDAGL